MSAVQQCNYKLDITLREYTFSARFVSVRIIWNAICTSIRKGKINERLLDIKEGTNLLDIEPLLVEQVWDLSLQILRDGVGRRHATDGNQRQYQTC